MNKSTLVLGASSNTDRYSNMAIERLLQHNIPVFAIGYKNDNTHGVTINKEKIGFKDVHTITLYLNPNNQKEYYNYILSLHPKRVIFNPGTENSELKQLLQQNHIEYIEACTLVMLSTGQY